MSSSKPSKETALPHKVVIRRLPAALPESIFWNTVDPYLVAIAATLALEGPCYDWRDYHPGKLARKPQYASNQTSTLPSRPSFAVIHFKSLEALVEFRNIFDGHIFQDAKGKQDFARVEFAPFQKWPKQVDKPDPKANTIEQGEVSHHL